MTKTRFSSSVALMGAAALVLGAAGVAVAQEARDPAYAAARSSGQVGEQRDGYLGVVGSQPAAPR